jgi:hypothetical protein
MRMLQGEAERESKGNINNGSSLLEGGGRHSVELSVEITHLTVLFQFWTHLLRHPVLSLQMEIQPSSSLSYATWYLGSGQTGRQARQMSEGLLRPVPILRDDFSQSQREVVGPALGSSSSSYTTNELLSTTTRALFVDNC